MQIFSIDEDVSLNCQSIVGELENEVTGIV